MKPSLNNVWGREINNQLRRFLNMPPLQDHDSGLLNLSIGDDEYLLALEPAAAEDVALLSLFRKVDRFALGDHLDALLQEVSISKNLPAPVHLALKAPDSVVLTVRIHRRASNEAARYLDMLFVIYANVEKRR